MKTERLFSVLSGIQPVTGTFKKAVEKALTPLSLPRYYMLLEAPKVSEHAYFINEGFVMSYMFMNAQKLVECFWSPGQFIVSTRSFLEQAPSREFIQLRDNSEILCISYSDVISLFDRFPEAQVIYRVMMNKSYEHSRERAREMRHLTARERLEKLIRTYPGVERHVTQEDIASYLGITPQSLSRIKRTNR